MRKILIVDDDPSICNMLSFLLKGMKYEVFISDNGMDAIEKVKNDKPDIVLLDIMMPEMGGIQTLSEIKKIDEKIKVIMITAYQKEKELIAEAFRLGASDCIFKPIDMRYLKENILQTMNFLEKRILVVEDNKSILRMVSMVLRRRDYIVFEAKNGLEGITIAENEKPDLIILDVGLPDMDGFEVCKSIKQNVKTRKARILMLSGKTSLKDEQQESPEGADAYLLKPFVTEQLLSKVKELLR